MARADLANAPPRFVHMSRFLHQLHQTPRPLGILLSHSFGPVAALNIHTHYTRTRVCGVCCPKVRGASAPRQPPSCSVIDPTHSIEHRTHEATQANRDDSQSTRLFDAICTLIQHVSRWDLSSESMEMVACASGVGITASMFAVLRISGQKLTQAPTWESGCSLLNPILPLLGRTEDPLGPLADSAAGLRRMYM